MQNTFYSKIYFVILFVQFAASAQEITFCRPNNMVSSLLYIAEQNNYFQEEGITPKFETVSNVKICFDLLSAGKAQVTNGAEGPLTYMSVLNPPFKVIAKLIDNPDTAVYARKDLGINRIEDLKGKRIGYLPGTISFLVLARLMEKYGWQKSDFKLTPMQPPTMALALVGGSIDAFIMWEPWGEQALMQLGEKGIRFSMNDYYVSKTLLVVNSDLLKDSPEVIKKILRAYIKAENYIATNKENAIKLISEKISYPFELLNKNWSDYTIKVKSDDNIINLMGQNFRLIKKYDQNFEGTQQPDFNSLMERSFLDSLVVDGN